MNSKQVLLRTNKTINNSFLLFFLLFFKQKTLFKTIKSIKKIYKHSKAKQTQHNQIKRNEEQKQNQRQEDMIKSKEKRKSERNWC